MPDPDLEIRRKRGGGGLGRSSRPLQKVALGGGSPKIFLSALGASVWSKNKGAGASPGSATDILL